MGNFHLHQTVVSLEGAGGGGSVPAKFNSDSASRRQGQPPSVPASAQPPHNTAVPASKDRAAAAFSPSTLQKVDVEEGTFTSRHISVPSPFVPEDSTLAPSAISCTSIHTSKATSPIPTQYEAKFSVPSRFLVLSQLP